MKHILILLFILALAHTVKADGPDTYQVEFTVELNNGKTIKGFVLVLDFQLDKDSFGNTDFLKRRLTEKYRLTEADVIDSLVFYRHIFEYNYYYPPSNSTGTEFQLVDRTAFHFDEIKQIKVVKYTASAYGGIINPVSMSDTAWTRKKPVSQVSIEGYLCSFYIMIHQKSPKVTAIMKELEKVQKEYEASKGNDPDTHYDIDSRIFDLIDKLKGEKVVAIEQCSC